MYIHLTLVPYIGHAGELKTKPTQHSVNELRRIGIQPDMVLCRSEGALPQDLRRKIALFASLPEEAIVSARDVDNVYKIPLYFRSEGVDDFVLDHFGMEAPPAELGEWEKLMRRASQAVEGERVRIALVGKYVQLEDAYLSVVESLRHAGWAHGCAVEVDWVDSETLDDGEVRSRLEQADGILIPGGFGVRGIEGKIAAARIAAREPIPVPRDLPRDADGVGRLRPPRRRHGRRELDRVRPRDAVPGHRPPARAEGGRRHGRHDAAGRRPIKLPRGHARGEIYGEAVIYERHRHRYEVNNFLRAAASRAAAWSCRAPRRTSAWSRSSRSPSTRSFVARSSTPSSSRARAPAPAVPRVRRRRARASLEQRPEDRLEAEDADPDRSPAGAIEVDSAELAEARGGRFVPR
jgi:CTP synthase